MSAKLTPLFPKEVPPIHVGVYSVEPDSIEWFSYWDGTGFGWVTTDKESAVREYRLHGITHPRLQWRGLASNPAEAKC